MKETYLSRDFQETAAQCFPSQAKELNAFFDMRLNALLAIGCWDASSDGGENIFEKCGRQHGWRYACLVDPTVRFVVTEKLSLPRDGLVITETEQAPPGDPGGACFIQTLMAVSQKFLKRITNQNLPCSAASATETAVETVAPTIGLLPIPIRPIIST